MKKLAILITTALLFISACRNEQAKDPELVIIEKIENSLLPPLIVEGEKANAYNITERMKYYKVPAVSIAFIDKGTIQWAKAYGYHSFDSLIASDENSLFQAASISKPIAAMAALSMVEEGKLGLDDNVNEYLKGWQIEENEFTKEEKVTLRRLLTHSAGLTVHGFRGYSANEEVPELIQVLNGELPANSDKVVPDIIPGSTSRYSGGGYTVMQKMLEDISGETFPALMEKRILAKIGMKNSSYMQPLQQESHSHAAIGHRPNGDIIEGRWHTYPEMAAAGLWTTPSDLLLYALEVQNSLSGNSNLVLSQEMTKEMLTRQIASQGLGPGLHGEGDTLTFGHGGANEGYRCQFIAFAKSGQGVAVMTNSDNGGALISEILRSFSKTYDWPFLKPMTKSIYQIEPERLNEYTGKYKWDQNELIAELTVIGNHLGGLQLWDSTAFVMFPESELVFFNKDDGATFEFKKDDNGNINEILIQRQYRFLKID